MLKPNDQELQETVLDDEPLTGPSAFLNMRRLTVRLPNGKTSTRDMVRHPGASAIVTLDAEGNIILERQWRAPLNRAFWEIPAGKIDSGEDPFDCARRELEEETGLQARRWVYLGTMHNAIGYSNEHIEVYLAQDLTQANQHLDNNEFLSLVHVSAAEAESMCADGSITDVKTITALFWLKKYLAGELAQARKLR